MLTLTIPPRRDPIARITLLGSIAVILYAAFVSATAPQSATAQADPPVVILATPTLPMMQPTDAPALTLSAPTPAPGLLDRALASAGAAANQFAGDQAAQLAQEQAAAAQAAADQAARDQYLANVGQQTPHSPRGDNPAQPPSFDTGPVAQPPNADGVQIVIDPNPVQASAPQIAAAVPPISQAQAAVIGARQSNGCAAGEVFYPRTGCHTPGSGGAQPGAVGQP